ncbi:hypothetical protein [Nonlabens sp. Asnod3-A02]|uniref:hypothetical protein n=1 Tax=Nonlabens sp. Asnod3-A02 TaxID=3160579 RepID=UPI00386E3FEC
MSFEMSAQQFQVSNVKKISKTTPVLQSALQSSDYFGYAVESIGDLNGDGIDDIAVGAIFDDDGGTNKGAVYIHFLDANDDVISIQKISESSGTFNQSLSASDIFGSSLSFLGDLNNDGKIELAVGSEYNSETGFRHGAFYILSLNSDGTVFSRKKISETSGGFTGNLTTWNVFSSDIEFLGDINGDGLIELAVGARRDQVSGVEVGSVYILSLNALFDVVSHYRISNGLGGFPNILSDGDAFGGAVANIGDLNGDGNIDLAIGAYRDNTSGANKGTVYIAFLNSNGTVGSYTKIAQNVSGFNENLNTSSFFGRSIDLIGDVDANNTVEVMIGASSKTDFNNIATGAFYILSLDTAGYVSDYKKYHNNSNSFPNDLSNDDSFGFSNSFINYQNSSLKLMSSAFKDDTGGNLTGAVYIINLGCDIALNTASTDPSSCGVADGEILISSLTANTAYEVSYDQGGTITGPLTLTTSTTGEILLSGLDAGNYQLTVSEGGCIDTPAVITLTAPTFTVAYAFTDPSSCGVADGEILISSLTANTAYEVSYDQGGTITGPLTLTTSATGEILLSGLDAGNYQLTVSEGGCVDTPAVITLTDPTFTVAYAFTDPSSCGVADGEILISSLTANTAYERPYFYSCLCFYRSKFLWSCRRRDSYI